MRAIRQTFLASLLFTQALVAIEAPQGWMGMGLVRQVDGDGNVFLHVERVLKGGPGERAGIAPGSIIVRIDKQPVSFKSDLDVLMFCRTLKPGRRLRLTIMRGKQTRDTILVVEPFPKELIEQWKAQHDVAAKQE
jgi:C-terminal processing protease CtpA/Prc